MKRLRERERGQAKPQISMPQEEQAGKEHLVLQISYEARGKAVLAAFEKGMHVSALGLVSLWKWVPHKEKHTGQRKVLSVLPRAYETTD